MESCNAIEVRNLTKRFKVYHDKGSQLKEKLLFSRRRKYEERLVLNNISFDIKKGEAVGLIGHNGCGKSTTLKLLSRILFPDIGSVEMKGRVSSLIELGAGFHPDMSGRENIYTNASIFGLTKKEIQDKIDDIIEFSELEEYIDNPVRTYSSGMYMRLAFAVAINVEADILLIDEILAVGDVAFQAKCFDTLRKIKNEGTTIIIVSHSLGQIEQICDKSMWIHEGVIKEVGSPREIHPLYLDYMGEKKRRKQGQEEIKSEARNTNISNNLERRELGNLDVEMTDIRLFNKEGIESYIYRVGESFELRVNYKCNNSRIESSEFGFNIFRNDGIDCYGTNTIIDKRDPIKINPQGKISIMFDSVNLLRGKYKIDIAFHDRVGLNYHYIYTAVAFEMISGNDEVGVTHVNCQWIID